MERCYIDFVDVEFFVCVDFLHFFEQRVEHCVCASSNCHFHDFAFASTRYFEFLFVEKPTALVEGLYVGVVCGCYHINKLLFWYVNLLN